MCQYHLKNGQFLISYTDESLLYYFESALFFNDFNAVKYQPFMGNISC